MDRSCRETGVKNAPICALGWLAFLVFDQAQRTEELRALPHQEAALLALITDIDQLSVAISHATARRSCWALSPGS